MIKDIKLQIWHLSGKSLEKVNQAREKVKGDPEALHYWETVLRRLTIIMQPVKKKAKPKTQLSDEQKKLYRDAKYNYHSKEFPNWVKDGHFIEPDYPDVGTSSGLQRFIIDFLTWNEHFANRTGNEGRVIKNKAGKDIRIPSSSKKGMQDIDANLKHPEHQFGIPWKIEIKIGADKQSDKQQRFESEVIKTGGVYSIVTSTTDFLLQYERLMLKKELV